MSICVCIGFHGRNSHREGRDLSRAFFSQASLLPLPFPLNSSPLSICDISFPSCDADADACLSE